MHEPYLIVTIPDMPFAAVVFATGPRNPLEHLNQLEQELSRQGICGTLLFDMLLFQGSKTNRYFIGTFDGKTLDKSLIKPSPTSEHQETRKILQDRYPELDPVLLTPAMQFALQAGIPLSAMPEKQGP